MTLKQTEVSDLKPESLKWLFLNAGCRHSNYTVTVFYIEHVEIQSSVEWLKMQTLNDFLTESSLDQS